MHMVSRKDLNSAEWDTVKVFRNTTTVVPASGEVLRKEEATVYVKELDLFVTVMLLEDTPAVLPLGQICEDHGYTHHWTSGQKRQFFKGGRRIKCSRNHISSKMTGKSIANTANHVPFVVTGLSTSSSTSSLPSSPTSSSQETVTTTTHPATERSESTSVEVQGNVSHELAETENTNKNDDDEELQSDQLQGVPDWAAGVQAWTGR